MRLTRCPVLLAIITTVTMAAPAAAQQQKPNILVMMGDAIGYWNISAHLFALFAALLASNIGNRRSFTLLPRAESAPISSSQHQMPAGLR